MIAENLTSALDLLNKKIKTASEQIKYYTWCEAFVQEKVKHTMDVLAVAQELLSMRKVPFSNEQAERLLFGALMHDIGRFREIPLLAQNPAVKHDHGKYSEEILREEGLTDEAMLMALCHHGHRTQDLETDPRFRKLSSQEQADCRQIFELVQDADKIANWQLYIDNPAMVNHINLVKHPRTKEVSKEILENFKNNELADYRFAKGFEDYLIGSLSWIFEIHWLVSYQLLQKRNLLDRIFFQAGKDMNDSLLLMNLQRMAQTYLDTKLEELIQKEAS